MGDPQVTQEYRIHRSLLTQAWQAKAYAAGRCTSCNQPHDRRRRGKPANPRTLLCGTCWVRRKIRESYRQALKARSSDRLLTPTAPV